MSSPIPVQNIYYLLIYAWNNLDEGELTDISNLESNELVDLFASVLNSGTKHLLRRGLDQDYILHDEAIAGVRGRINIGITVRQMLLQHGRACLLLCRTGRPWIRKAATTLAPRRLSAAAHQSLVNLQGPKHCIRVLRYDSCRLIRVIR